MLYGGPGQDGTGLQVINNTDLQQRDQAGRWGQLALVSSFGSSSGMVRGWEWGGGGLELAKTEEAAAGMGSPFPRGSILPQSQAPAGQGRGMGDGVTFLGLGQIGAWPLGAWFCAPAFEQGWSRRTGELALHVSAATGLRGHGLGTARLPQLAKRYVTILNA